MKKLIFFILANLCLLSGQLIGQEEELLPASVLDYFNCETFGRITRVANVPTFVNTNCNDVLPRATITFYDPFSTVQGTVLTFSIANSSNDEVSSRGHFFQTSFIDISLRLPRPTITDPVQQDVVYKFCVSDGECIKCREIPVRFHDGTYVPLDLSFETCQFKSGCSTGDVLKNKDLIGTPPVVGQSPEADVLACCDNTTITSQVSHGWEVGLTFTGSKLPVDLSVSGGRSWTEGIEFTGPPDGCAKFAVSYLECDIDGTYYEFAEECSQQFTEAIYSITGIQKDHAVVPCFVEGSGERCNQKYKPIVRPPGINGGGYGIELETIDPSIIFEIEWRGPNEYESNQINIDNLDFGRYCYTLTDVCCETHTGCAYVCDGELEETPFEYDEATDQWCRQITCRTPGNPGFQSAPTSAGSGSESSPRDEVYEECIAREDLSFGPWEFDFSSKKCQRELSFEGEVIGIEEKAAEILEYYDKNLNACVRDYYCNGTLGLVDHTEQEIPFLGPWQVDIISDVCYKEVTCFNELQEERKEEEIEYEWTFNNLTGQCEGKPFCGGSQVFGAPTEYQFPFTKGNWNYDPVTKECYRSIQCTVDLNSTAEQRIDAQVTWTYNEFSDQCEARVFCNGYEIFGAGIPGQIPYSTEVTVTTQGPTCTRTVQCTFDSPIETQTETGQLVVTTNDLTCSANQTTYAIYCFGEDTGERVCGGGLKGGATNRFSSIIEREMQLRVNPNPFNSEVTLSIESTFEHQSTIEIRDVTGKVIKRMQQHLIKGNNIFIADQLAELPDGIYLLVVLSDTGVVLAQDKLLKSNWK